MSQERIPTELWVKAHIKRLNLEGIPVVVIRHGDPHSGIVILKLNQHDEGFRVMSQMRHADGQLGWLEMCEGKSVSEEEADAYISRQTLRDPDLWVLEVEDRYGRHWFDGNII